MRHVVFILSVLLAWSATSVGALAQQPERPAGSEAGPDETLTLGLEEQVEVKFVLVDFLVLDRQRRPAADLTVDDFFLKVDNRDVEIASLDRSCDAVERARSRRGADAPADAPAADATDPETPKRTPRQIVLAFDYTHISNPAETIERALAMVSEWSSDGDRHMVLSMGEVVRIEMPFTPDLEDVRWALRRMLKDPDLYGGNFGRVSEHKFFERMEAVYDLLEREEGRKSVVLFSAPFDVGGFNYDPQFKQLSAMSTISRTSIYPVDTGGLRGAFDPRGSDLPALTRLALETGGRVTRRTNDITLAYDNAHRDMGCNYTIGFYDRLEEDKKREIEVGLRDRKQRRALRVYAPDNFVVRSDEEKRKSLRQTATLTPHVFESDQLDAELFVLGPKTQYDWRTLLAVTLSEEQTAALMASDDPPKIRALIRKQNGTIVRRFEEELERPTGELGAAEARGLSLYRELSMPPGKYVVSAVLTHTDLVEPRSATRPVSLARIPKAGAFLVGPLIGRAEDLADRDGAKSRRDDRPFRPLLTASARRGEPLAARTVVCIANSDADVVDTLQREISRRDGSEARPLPPSNVDLPKRGALRCQALVDDIETGALEPGEYELRASTGEASEIAPDRAVSFSIEEE